MASSVEYIEYVYEQIVKLGDVRYRKMFGEYMVYINDKPVILVCDDTPYVKCLACIEEQMKEADKGTPYKGAKEHYILDIENKELCEEVLITLESVTPIPKPRKKKKA